MRAQHSLAHGLSIPANETADICESVAWIEEPSPEISAARVSWLTLGLLVAAVAVMLAA